MKKVFLSMVMVGIMALASFSSVAEAASSQITINQHLGYGSTGSEVIKLQQYLMNLGYLKISVATGNYLTITTQAVKAYQLSEEIDSTGYFGPLTQASVNTTLVAVTDAPKASINSVSASLLASSKTIHWQTNGYSNLAGVNVNLLKKTSESPANYELVRTIASNTPNTGSIEWNPTSSEIFSDNLYIEVTCTPEAEYGDGCHILGAPIKVS